MKRLTASIFMALTLLASTVAQTQPDLEVTKFSWHKLHHNTIPSGRQAQAMRNAQIDSEIAAEERKPPQERDTSKILRLRNEKRNQVTPLDRPDPTKRAYEYKFKFKNHGTKEVVRIHWIFVFRDADTHKVLVAHGFDSDTSIKPGKEKELISYTDSSPPQIVDAQALEKTGKPWEEEVIVSKITYADGSQWERK